MYSQICIEENKYEFIVPLKRISHVLYHVNLDNIQFFKINMNIAHEILNADKVILNLNSFERLVELK